MEKYIIAPPAGSQTNALGAKDRPWEEVHANRYPGINEYLAESTGYGIVSGCEPSISGLTVKVGAGVIHLADGTRKEISASNITLDSADSTNPRIDLVYITSTGTVAKITGTAASPSAPALPTGGISVCNITVAAKSTNGILVDKRLFLAKLINGGLEAKKIQAENIVANVVNDTPKENKKFGMGVYCNDWYYTWGILYQYKQVGIDTIRTGYPWQQAEPSKGEYAVRENMSWPLSQLALFDIMPIICINGGNTNYGTEAGKIDNQEAVEGYANVAKALAELAVEKGVKKLVIEVLNEPGSSLTYITYNKYVELVKKTYESVKSVNADYEVIAYLGTSSGDYNFSRQCLVNGIADFCDGFSTHIYSSTSPEKDKKRIDKYKQDYARYTNRKLKYYVTETGYETLNNQGTHEDKYATESDRSKWLPRRVLNFIQNDDVYKTCFHVDVTSYTGTDPENYFGLFQATSTTDTRTPTPTWNAIATLGTSLKEHRYVKALYCSKYNEMLFEKDGVYKLCVWTDGDTFTKYIEGEPYTISGTPQVIEVNKPYELENLYNDSKECGLNYGESGAEVFNDYYRNNALGDYSTARGTGVNAIGTGAFASGVDSYTNADFAFAHGNKALASGIGSVACGLSVKASSNGCVAIGHNVVSSGYASAVFGFKNTASGQQNIVGGVDNTVAGHYSLVIGSGHNIPSTIFTAGIFGINCAVKSGSDRILVGNGFNTAPTNSFRVESTGNVYCTGTYNTTGADYAEYFEWSDGNADNEDRVGYFVTLDNNKIRIAKSTDSYILGIVSGNASVIGNSYNDQWQNMYVTDDFGRVQYEEVEVADVKDEEGNIIFPAHTEKRMKINPEYDNTQEYIGRENRKEWSAVGMLGVLPVRDDGTCEVNGYCKVADGGIATKANSGYRVVARVADNIIKVLFR